MKPVLLAFGMFSALPVPRIEWNEKNMRYMMCAFPLVGAAIALLCVICFVSVIQCSCFWQRQVPLSLPALAFTLVPVAVTGGIHVDGFMDTCDALASHAPREKKLDILKDSHSGAFAVMGCVLYFLSYFVLSLELCGYFFGADSSRRFMNFFGMLVEFAPFCFIFVLSRLLSAFAVAVFPVAKKSGLVHTFAGASAKEFTAVWCGIWSLLILAALTLFSGISGILIAASSLAVFGFYYFMAKRNFGGITGDTAGWFVQMCELSGLAAFVISLFA